MSRAFDPYHVWLGIPPKDQPPHHYRLLGVELFESDPDVIQHAADQRMAHVRSLQSGKQAAATQRILSEIAAARLCLLGPGKADYDRTLSATLQAQGRVPVPVGKAVAVKPVGDLEEIVAAARRPAPRRRAARPGWRRPVTTIVAAAGLLLLTLAAFFIAGRRQPPGEDVTPPPAAAPRPAMLVIPAVPDETTQRWVDLADIVGGGNGFGAGRKGAGIDPSTGTFGSDFGHEMRGPVNRYQRTASPLVDGVFVPNGSDHGEHLRVQVASTGITVNDLSSTTGHWQGLVKNGPDTGSQAVLNLVDYQSPGHSVLGLHANLGVTFDLAAIGQLVEPRRPHTFTAWLGNSGTASTEFRVYLDGRRAAAFTQVTSAQGGILVQVPLGDAHFLTLIALDSGSFGQNATFLGDPRLLFGGVANRSP